MNRIRGATGYGAGRDLPENVEEPREADVRVGRAAQLDSLPRGDADDRSEHRKPVISV
jgi:hypothetical protein